MQVYQPDQLRNLVFVGAKGVGKTSLLDALAFHGRVNSRLGRVDDGTSLFDCTPQAIKRRATLQCGFGAIEWHQHKINLIDTPGFADFFGESVAGIAAADVVILCVDAVNGVQVHTKRLYETARAQQKPVVLLITKLDHAQADFERTVAACRESLGARTALLQMPIGAGAALRGVVSLLHLKAYHTTDGRTTAAPAEGAVLTAAQQARTEIMDDVAEADEALMAKYLEGQSLSDAELHHGIVEGIEAGTLVPIICASAQTGCGVEAFLNMAVDWLPAPTEIPPMTWTRAGTDDAEPLHAEASAPLAAYVFKASFDPGLGDIYFFRVVRGSVQHGDDVYNATTQTNERMGHLFVIEGRERVEVPVLRAGDVGAAVRLKATGVGHTLCKKDAAGTFPAIPFPEPMVQLALHPKAKADQGKLGMALSKFAAVDPCLRVQIDAEFHETIISGLGDIHLEVLFEQLHERGVEFEVGRPRIPYRERLLKKVRVQGKYKRQSGGRGQYGDCWMEVSPLPIGHGILFETHIFGGAVPAKYLPAIEKGAREAAQQGRLAGYPVVDVKIDVVDGSYHDVDSSDMAFQIAGSLAFKQAEEDAGEQLTEPIMQVEITTPPGHVGDITSDISGRRGRMLGMDTVGANTVIRANIPLAELYKYATHLRALTSGAATHTMHCSHYDVVPAAVAERAIKDAQQYREAREKQRA